MSLPIRLPDLTIPLGEMFSNPVTVNMDLSAFKALSLAAPATLDGGAVFTIQAASQGDMSADDWHPISYAPGTQLNIAPNEMVVLGGVAAFGFRIASDTPVAADRVFRVITRP